MLYRPISDRLKYDQHSKLHPKRAVKDAPLKEAARLAVMEKISSGQYKYELRPCPGCSSDHLDTIADVERHGLRYPMSICRECGLVHANPALREEDYKDFYTLHFRRLYQAREGMPSLGMLEKKKNSNLGQIERIIQRAPVIKELASQGKRLLDVGCGGGNFTWAWQETGFKSTGIDLNGEYQDIGRAQGLDLRAESLADFVGDQTFDVIFYHHVLEHIIDPVRELGIANQALNEGGLLIVVVPGLFSAPKTYLGDLRDYFHIAHVTAFTRGSLTHVAARAGFAPIAVDEHVYGIFQKSTNVTDMVPHYAGSAQYEDAMRFMIDLEAEFGTEAGIYAILERYKARVEVRQRTKRAAKQQNE